MYVAPQRPAQARGPPLAVSNPSHHEVTGVGEVEESGRAGRTVNLYLTGRLRQAGHRGLEKTRMYLIVQCNNIMAWEEIKHNSSGCGRGRHSTWERVLIGVRV